MKVCDGVYSYVWKGVMVNNCNTYYFGEPFNILFDPGLANYVDTRFEEMKRDDIDPKNIKHVVNTHCHPDHFEGSEQFMNDGLPIAMLDTEIEFLNQFGPGFFQMFGMAFPELTFENILKEGIWNIEGSDLEIIHTPGHSPGSACIYWKEKKTMVCGDLVFQQSVGRTDFPGGDGKKMVESIKKIMNYDIEYLLPGHMDIIVGADEVKKNFELIEQYYFSMME